MQRRVEDFPHRVSPHVIDQVVFILVDEIYVHHRNAEKCNQRIYSGNQEPHIPHHLLQHSKVERAQWQQGDWWAEGSLQLSSVVSPDSTTESEGSDSPTYSHFDRHSLRGTT